MSSAFLVRNTRSFSRDDLNINRSGKVALGAGENTRRYGWMRDVIAFDHVIALGASMDVFPRCARAPLWTIHIRCRHCLLPSWNQRCNHVRTTDSGSILEGQCLRFLRKIFRRPLGLKRQIFRFSIPLDLSRQGLLKTFRCVHRWLTLHRANGVAWQWRSHALPIRGEIYAMKPVLWATKACDFRPNRRLFLSKQVLSAESQTIANRRVIRNRLLRLNLEEETNPFLERISALVANSWKASTALEIFGSGDCGHVYRSLGASICPHGWDGFGGGCAAELS